MISAAFMEAIAKAIWEAVEAEREACARICEEILDPSLAYDSAEHCAREIRARKP
jgi:hypothetical protein